MVCGFGVLGLGVRRIFGEALVSGLHSRGIGFG